MEKLRQAIRELEAQAEKFERYLGAERFPAPSDEFFERLTVQVRDVRDALLIQGIEPIVSPKPVSPEKPAEATKGEELPV